MTGSEFEKAYTQHLMEYGYWALNIPKNQFGAQPFDILAIKGSFIMAIDCKVCRNQRLELRRVEDNQMLGFEMIRRRADVLCGFVCLWEGMLFFIPFEDVQTCSRSSIKLDYDYCIGEL